MSESIEEYLEAIYYFNEEGKLAKNNDIAKRVRVSPPSVTQMLKNLAESGLITYKPYNGVSLTGRGTAYAQKVVRKHRLLETFFHNILEMDKEKVHAEACRIEHNLSYEATAALCSSLKKPTSCPDDNRTIPPCTFNVKDCTECKSLREKPESENLITQLSNLKSSEEAVVSFIRAGGNTTQRIINMGITPGATIKITNSETFRGPKKTLVQDTQLSINHNTAEKIFVEIKHNQSETMHPHGPRHN